MLLHLLCWETLTLQLLQCVRKLYNRCGLPSLADILPTQVLCTFCSAETRRVHVYGQQWELQAQGYEPVKFNAPLARYENLAEPSLGSFEASAQSFSAKQMQLRNPYPCLPHRAAWGYLKQQTSLLLSQCWFQLLLRPVSKLYEGIWGRRN